MSQVVKAFKAGQSIRDYKRFRLELCIRLLEHFISGKAAYPAESNKFWMTFFITRELQQM